jgi:hypothetical protein
MKWVGKKHICPPKWVKNGYILTFLEIYPIASRHNHADDLKAIN